MHLVFVPITDDDRLSAKDIIGGPEGCRKWQEEFYAKMAEAFPDLQRGEPKELTGREHIPTALLKELDYIGNPDKRYAMVKELKTLRKIVGSIPGDIKKEIADLAKQQMSGASPEVERTR